MNEGVRGMLASGGVIAARLPGYEERPEQLELAAAVEKALAENHHLLAEAGTGVGKSFAYLLPAVLHAETHPGQGPVVVSTRTIGLQEQLDQKDLPFLHAVLPLEWSAVTAVGRNHYLCLRRMHHAFREQGLFEHASQRADLQRVVDWSLSTREGTRMDLPRPVADEVWEEVRAEHGNCLHRACPHYEPCHWQRARRRMHTAQILVVNHALYMADVALRMAGATYLPPHRVVVFDEAHHLERVATEGLGLRLSPGTLEWHLRRLHPRKSSRSLLGEHGSPRALLLLGDVRAAGEAFFAGLGLRMERAADREGVALEDEVLEDPLSEPLLALVDEVLSCSLRVQQLDLRMELQSRAQGLQGLYAVLQALCRPPAEDGPEPRSEPLVRWLEPARRGPVLRGAPLDVSSALRRHVFGEDRTAVLVSATLGPGGDPEYGWLRRALGVDEAACLRLGSPFDYRSNVELVLEEALPDPGRDPRAFTERALERVLGHVLANGGRALVLCTSWSFVRRAADVLRGPLQEAGIPLLVQGDAPLARLLQEKRERPTSVLVGTDSLWEGIDLPGDSLTLLLLTRLPFSSPGHPLTKARLRAIAARGGDPFREQSLPEAVLKFRQGFGRLIRSGSDTGKVVVLDPRARTRPYGRHFLSALPTTPDPLGGEAW